MFSFFNEDLKRLGIKGNYKNDANIVPVGNRGVELAKLYKLSQELRGRVREL